MHRFKKASVSAVAVAVALLGMASFSAQATVIPPTTTFLFNSLCEDCVTDESDSSKNHPVSATLVLNGEYGTGVKTFVKDDFVSFSYSGTNKLAAYEITAANLEFFEGLYNGDAEGSWGRDFNLNVTFADANHFFMAYQQIEGADFWDTGTTNNPADTGGSVNWQNANNVPNQSTVPEPATMLLLGAGLAGLGLTRRRKV